MNYQIVNSNKEVEKFIKDNLVLQFSKVEEILFQNFLISTAYNLAKKFKPIYWIFFNRYLFINFRFI